MRTAAVMLMCAALAACGGGDANRDQTSSSGARPDTTAPPAAAPRGDSATAAPAAAASGQSVYGRTCITCHQATGRGMPNAFPPLAGSTYATGDKNRLIRIVLHGLQGQWTASTGGRYNGVMPPWKTQLNDADMAAVLTYVRSSFGNSASAVTAVEVAAARAATASRNTPYTQQEIGAAR